MGTHRKHQIANRRLFHRRLGRGTFIKQVVTSSIMRHESPRVCKSQVMSFNKIVAKTSAMLNRLEIRITMASHLSTRLGIG